MLLHPHPHTRAGRKLNATKWLALLLLMAGVSLVQLKTATAAASDEGIVDEKHGSMIVGEAARTPLPCAAATLAGAHTATRLPVDVGNTARSAIARARARAA